MDIHVSDAMTALGIRKIERHLTIGFTVTLDDGRIGGGKTVGDAYAKAALPNAESVDHVRVAA